MGNFVSFPHSRSTPAPLPRRRVEADTQPPVPSLSSPPSTGRCPLTSSLATHASRLVRVLRWPTTGRTRPRPTDLEGGMPPACSQKKDTEPVVTQGIPRCSSSPRRRALLIGISYNGELLNTHKDVDRYRDVLLGMTHIISHSSDLY
jgi:hypothetical protein